VIDCNKGEFTVQAFASGLLSGLGHSPSFAVSEFSGQVTVPDEDTGKATCFIVIKTNSLLLLDKVSEHDRHDIEGTMRTKVLEVSRFPEIVFVGAIVSSQSGKAGDLVELAGELTLHGKERTHLVNAEVRIDDREIRARGESKVRQTEYAIQLVSVAGGMLKVKDEVKVSFDLVGNAVSAAA
jgi:polyisoprenoid-binding protein YceI